MQQTITQSIIEEPLNKKYEFWKALGVYLLAIILIFGSWFCFRFIIDATMYVGLNLICVWAGLLLIKYQLKKQYNKAKLTRLALRRASGLPDIDISNQPNQFYEFWKLIGLCLLVAIFILGVSIGIVMMLELFVKGDAFNYNKRWINVSAGFIVICYWFITRSAVVKEDILDIVTNTIGMILGFLIMLILPGYIVFLPIVCLISDGTFKEEFMIATMLNIMGSLASGSVVNAKELSPFQNISLTAFNIGIITGIFTGGKN